MGRIRWTEKAANHLEAIHDYIAKDSPTYAKRFIRSLIAATSKLGIMPACGRNVPEFPQHEYREVLYQNYRIVYRIAPNGEDVEILVVIHAARDFVAAFRDEWEL